MKFFPFHFFIAPFCNNGDLRLFGGDADNEGTLEICLNQAWGTVCDDFWDNNDAKVACRKLGFQPEGTKKELLLIKFWIYLP